MDGRGMEWKIAKVFGWVATVVATATCGGTPTTPTPGPSESPDATYEEALPDGSVPDSGLFVVHRGEGKLLFEIPDSLLGRDMLLISRIAQTPADLSPFLNAGSKVAEQLVRWHRMDDRILLRKHSFQSVADEGLAVHESVIRNNFAPIIGSFEIEAETPDSAAVLIDVTALYEGDVPAISGLNQERRTEFGVRRLDGDRTFIDRAASYPLNVEVRHTTTFEATKPPSDAGTGTISMQMAQSMVLLPAEPMRPRYADSRVGWFTVDQINFGLDELKAASQSLIRRWRLEPSDPEAYRRGELVDPVKPIVWYLDPATPEKWRPYMREGIEDWQAAFETAGFSNAVIAKDPPTEEEDPEFSPEDVRYSVVRWVASLTRNATGPSVSDPRTGEIIESDVIWYHNHMRSYRNRLMIETGAANPDARTLAVPDRLMGEAMRQVIAHEVGHALGLPHNMIASSSYPVDSLRSPTFTERMGVAPSVMDYARQNYIAQPGDGVERFIRKIGPYDHYAINWGYRVINSRTAEDERPILAGWIGERSGDPMYRFGESFPPIDPRAQTEDMGDDPVAASTYAIQNLQRVTPNLVEWTSIDGRDYTDLDELYGELLEQWSRYIGHVVTVVGGVHRTLKASDQEGPVFEYVPADQQRRAVAFLSTHLFDAPTWLHDEEILKRIEYAGAVDRIRQMQVGRLNQMLDPARLQRLIEFETFRPEDAYRPGEFMDDVREAVWVGVRRGRPIDAYRRNLQRGYLERMEWLMTEEPDPPPDFPIFRGMRVDVSQSDIRPLVRHQLTQLKEEVSRGRFGTSDESTRWHLDDVLVRIDDILEGPDRP